jgi:ribonuclease HII
VFTGRSVASVGASDLGERLLGPSKEFEQEARRCGYRHIAGLDEAGRGPLAGPVVAAAVILPVICRLPGVNDSKQLTQAEREQLFAAIFERAVGIGIGSADASEIDTLNILEATRLAMRRALEGMETPPDYLLIDALTLPGVAIPSRPIIKGDALSISIAAASIIAKVTRDRLMATYHGSFPQYNFVVHKGYGTEDHLRRLEDFGPCAIHRRTFAPVRQALLLPQSTPMSVTVNLALEGSGC